MSTHRLTATVIASVLLASPSFAQQGDAPLQLPPGAIDIERPRVDLFLPSPIKRDAWEAILKELALQPSDDLQKARDDYDATWDELTKGTLKELDDLSQELAKQYKDQTEYEERFVDASERSAKAAARARALEGALFASLENAVGKERLPEVQMIRTRLQRQEAYRTLARLPIWSECSVDPNEVVEALKAKSKDDFSAITAVLQEQLLANTPKIITAARQCRDAQTKEHAILLEHATILKNGAPDAEAAASDVLARRTQLWKRAAEQCKSVRNDTRSLIETLVRTLPEPQSTALREAFQLRLHPRIYTQRTNYRLMFDKVREVEGGSPEFVELLKSSTQDFEQRFGRSAKAEIDVDDEWIGRFMQADAIANSERELFQSRRQLASAERTELARQTWTKLLAPLPPEKKAQLEKWISPTAGQNPGERRREAATTPPSR